MPSDGNGGGYQAPKKSVATTYDGYGRQGSPSNAARGTPRIGSDRLAQIVAANKSQQSAKADQTAFDYARWAAATSIPDSMDPFGGQSLQDMFAQLVSGPNGSGGGTVGGGRGGSGGSSAAAQQAALEALNQVLWNGTVSYNDQMTNTQNTLQGLLGGQQSTLQQLLAQQQSGAQGLLDQRLAGLTGQQSQWTAQHDALGAQQQAALDQALAALNQGFANRNTQLSDTRDQSATRVNGIVGDLNTAAGQAKGASDAAFANTQSQLQQLAARYAQQQATQSQGANQTLGAFGAGTASPVGNNLQDMLAASQGRNVSLQGAQDQLYAGRGNVYAGLGADANMQNNQLFNGLMAQLQAQQQGAAAQTAQQKAALALQLAGQSNDFNTQILGQQNQAQQDYASQLAGYQNNYASQNAQAQSDFASQQAAAQQANQQGLLQLQLAIAQQRAAAGV